MRAQIAISRAITARNTYERIREEMPEDVPRGPRLALEAGIRHVRTWIAFWEDLAR